MENSGGKLSLIKYPEKEYKYLYSPLTPGGGINTENLKLIKKFITTICFIRGKRGQKGTYINIELWYRIYKKDVYDLNNNL